MQKKWQQQQQQQLNEWRYIEENLLVHSLCWLGGTYTTNTVSARLPLRLRIGYVNPTMCCTTVLSSMQQPGEALAVTVVSGAARAWVLVAVEAIRIDCVDDDGDYNCGCALDDFIRSMSFIYCWRWELRHVSMHECMCIREAFLCKVNFVFCN